MEKMKVFYLDPKFYEKFSKAMSEMQTAYAYALENVRSEMRKEIRK